MATVEIIDRLFRKPVDIVENDVVRRVSRLEAILMRLWAAEMSGSKRAGRVRLQFLELIPKDEKEREIIFEKIYQPWVTKEMLGRRGQTGHD